MEIGSVIGITVGILTAVILFCLAAVWLEKRYPSESYDERQKIARGKASGLSLGVGVVYFLIISLVMMYQVQNPKTIEPYLLVIIGLMLIAMVDHTYCLLCHAALPLSQKAVWMIVAYFFLGVAQIWRFFMVSGGNPMSLVGTGTSTLLSLILAVGFLYLALMHTIALLRDRKETNE